MLSSYDICIFWSFVEIIQCPKVSTKISFSQKKMKKMHIRATWNIISFEYIFPIFGVLANVPIVVLQNGSVFARNTKKYLFPVSLMRPLLSCCPDWDCFCRRSRRGPRFTAVPPQVSPSHDYFNLFQHDRKKTFFWTTSLMIMKIWRQCLQESQDEDKEAGDLSTGITGTSRSSKYTNCR